MAGITRWSLYRFGSQSKNPLPESWQDQLVRLWTEDDSGCEDRERTPEACNRIFRQRKPNGDPIARADWGDAGGDLYSSGVFVGWSCEGGFLSVLADFKEAN
ncbi:MAG: hypothetical protein AAF196_06075 [Planctomycetota bacterium]